MVAIHLALARVPRGSGAKGNLGMARVPVGKGLDRGVKNLH